MSLDVVKSFPPVALLAGIVDPLQGLRERKSPILGQNVSQAVAAAFIALAAYKFGIYACVVSYAFISVPATLLCVGYCAVAVGINALIKAAALPAILNAGAIIFAGAFVLNGRYSSGVTWLEQSTYATQLYKAVTTKLGTPS